MKSVATILIICFSLASFGKNDVDINEQNRREDCCVHANFWAGVATAVVFLALGTWILVPQDDFNMIRTSNNTNTTVPTYSGHQPWSLGVGIPFVLIGVSGVAWTVGSVVTGFALSTCLTRAARLSLHRASIAH